ncbi:MAG: vWA domain-containing protein [Planctomycetota bacterium]
MREFAFQIPWALAAGSLIVAVVMVWNTSRLRKSDLTPTRFWTLAGLRTALLLSLVALLARPVWTSPEQEDDDRNAVALLIDRSESMSVREGERTRYQLAVDFARDVLLPQIDQSNLEIEPVLFSGNVVAADGDEIASAEPDGSSTNLGKAIVESVVTRSPPPLVAIALTDGVVTHTNDHARAVASLVTNAVPMIGIGFGSQTGGRVVTLEDLAAPSLVEPMQSFRMTARLSATGQEIPSMQILLLRDGQLLEQRRIESFDGPRVWTESFEVSVEEEAIHSYEVRLMPPADESVTIAKAEATTLVRVVESKQIRILYVQGGLTWDYKFANIAISQDPTLQLSGLSRTASTSKFFENVQNDVDLVGGFPNTLDKLSDFRVVVLSNLRPGDLTPFQQQLLADFCGKLGGGLLMIGGPQTFNASWRESRLEQLLPVRFGVFPDRGLETVFRIQPTEVALRHPVFQISEQMTTELAWRDLPQFQNRAIVEDVKPGAEVWLEDRSGSVVMASQRYGNGFASVICMQNLWRWRLSREGNPDHFDRFWLQLVRYLAEAGREVYSITTSNLSPTPGERVKLNIDHRTAAGEDENDRRRVRLVVQDADRKNVFEKSLEIQIGKQATVSFAADSVGMLTATLFGPGEQVLATREIEVRDAVVELAKTARDMEVLRQFAGVSGGIAIKAESVDDPSEWLSAFLEPEEPPKLERRYAQPAGVNGWVLAFLLACVSIEWICRKRWNLI